MTEWQNDLQMVQTKMSHIGVKLGAVLDKKSAAHGKASHTIQQFAQQRQMDTQELYLSAQGSEKKVVGMFCLALHHSTQSKSRC